MSEVHAINTAFRYAYVQHSLPKPFPQVYIWKKAGRTAMSSLHSRASLDNYN